MRTNKKGISLLVLIITIIIILIFSATVILSLVKDNPIKSANKSVFLNDLSTFKEELELYKSNQYLVNRGKYNQKKLQADDLSITYDDTIYSDKNITDIISGLEKTNKYAGEFAVVDGVLIYQGTNKDKQNWSNESGIEVVIVGAPKVTITNPSHTLALPGTDISYIVKFSSKAPIKKVNLTDKIELVTDKDILVNPQPEIIIGEVSGTNADVIREVLITIKTDNLMGGGYKLKVKSGAVTNSNDQSNMSDVVSHMGFDIDRVVPANPEMSPSPADYTNGNVSVSIIYSNQTHTKEYSLDGANWQIYIKPVVVTTNNTTVYARGLSIGGNESGVATLTVSNIDKTPPQITITASNITSSTIKINVVATDEGSGIKENTYQYSKDNGTTWTEVTNQTSYTFTGLVAGSYNIKARVSDKANNIATTATLTTLTENLGTVTLTPNTTNWTNLNVTVTMNYPSGVVTKQYSLDGTNWQTYINPVVITTNNTTVYARGLDVAQNATGEATLTVSNIDKTLPTISFGINGGNHPTVVSTTVAVADSASGINTAEYVWDIQNTNTPTSGWSAFANGANLTKSGEGKYYLWIKAVDKAGNTNTICSNRFIVGEFEEIVSEVSTYNKTFSGTQSGYSYNNPVIPAGFAAVDTNEASWSNLNTDWNNGLVIQDKSGNQFVWVPVDGSNVKFEKWCTTNISHIQTSDATQPSGYNVSSITTKYKGFYIARYVSSNAGGNIAASKKKKEVWNFIAYANAKTYSEQMASKCGYNTSLVGTMMVNGTQWDTAMRWIQNSGKSVTDSRAWGNYSNSTSPANVSGYGTLQVTGFSDHWRAKNIYDLAGNLWEWTGEIYSGFLIIRGGHASDNGISRPAAYRNTSSPAYSINSISFRVSLYIM